MSSRLSITPKSPKSPTGEDAVQPSDGSLSSSTNTYASSSEEASTSSRGRLSATCASEGRDPRIDIESYLRASFVMHPEVAGPLLQFPIEMYLSMRGEGSDANVLLCPWYLACALVVMYHGASGATRRQIAQAMHVDDDGSVVSVLDSHASRMFCRDYRRPLHTHSDLALQEVARNCGVVGDALNIVKDVSNAILESKNRRTVYSSVVLPPGNDGGEQDCSGPSTLLLPLCPTRWTVTVKSMERFVENYERVQATLKDISSLSAQLVLLPTLLRDEGPAASERILQILQGLNVTSYSCLFHDERVKLSSYFVEPLSGLDMHSHVRDFARSSAQCCRGLNGLLRSLAGFAFQEDVFGKGSIDADTMVVLASVFSFQSRWFCDGDARALTGHFCRPSGEGGVVKETVPMLRLRGSFRFANFKDDDGFEVTVLEIPFQDPRRSIAIFLPAQSSSFEALEDRLDAPNVLKCLSRLERHRLAEVILPKLKMNCVADLKRHLPLLGAVNVFTEAADLCNMSTLEGLKVSAAKQVSVFSIGRRGAGTPEAQAAASDATRTVLGTDAVKIVVDRPFFFLIVARDPDTVLLLGSVTRVL
ncbi:hypothetical protein HPB48_018719 [Haemaphysalis longicornis]|uniref:Serpin domain-containing protein n=1 Tax=Haemaphysalis longicornis TaxID=44386 RepID=A0A9J6GMZ8_HAELO|nr:hypothetical protein HPB48_018719 [Haemaphysalis longicornis]